MASCGKCLHKEVCVDYRYYKPNAEKCRHFKELNVDKKTQTNAEWMRNMTEKEMVEFIGHNSLCDRVQGEAGNWCNNHNCTDCLREWLKQTAE